MIEFIKNAWCVVFHTNRHTVYTEFKCNSKSVEILETRVCNKCGRIHNTTYTL